MDETLDDVIEREERFSLIVEGLPQEDRETVFDQIRSMCGEAAARGAGDAKRMVFSFYYGLLAGRLETTFGLDQKEFFRGKEWSVCLSDPVRRKKIFEEIDEDGSGYDTLDSRILESGSVSRFVEKWIASFRFPPPGEDRL